MNQQTRYKIVSGPDGILWVSLQPLLHDIIEQSQNCANNPEITRPLETVRSFISALIAEGTSTQEETIQ